MITGQRVHFKRDTNSGTDEGDGIVVAFFYAMTSEGGFIDDRGKIVVQADDGRFLYLQPGAVRVVAEVLA